jgi:hypothetical protein
MDKSRRLAFYDLDANLITYDKKKVMGKDLIKLTCWELFDCC